MDGSVECAAGWIDRSGCRGGVWANYEDQKTMLSRTVPHLTAWSTLSPLPIPVAGGYLGLSHGELLYGGGTTWIDGTKQWLSSTERHSLKPPSKGWVPGPQLPRPLAYGSCAHWRDGIEIFGGTDGKSVSGDCWRLSSDGQRWQRHGAMPKPMLLSQAVVVDNRVYLFGGAIDPALSTFTDEVWMREDDRWHPIGKLPQGAFAAATSAAPGDGRSVYVFGGCSTRPEGVTNRSDALRFDIRSGTWKPVRPLPFAARIVAGVAIDARNILLAGGYAESGFSRRCFIYDSEADAYQDGPDLPLGLAGAAIVRAGEFVYLCGGEPQMRARSPLFLRTQLVR
jgi:N-acetylneuraminic acid mutarotase